MAWLHILCLLKDCHTKFPEREGAPKATMHRGKIYFVNDSPQVKDLILLKLFIQKYHKLSEASLDLDLQRFLFLRKTYK